MTGRALLGSAPFDPRAFDAVIFDCDGVLADSEPASIASWLTTLDTLRVEVAEDEIGSFIGMTDRAMAEHFSPLAGLSADDVEQTARRSFLDIVAPQGIDAFPDGVALIEHVKALEIPFGVASNSPRWRLDAVLGGAGLTSLVTLTVAGDEVPRPKPAPDVYLAVADALDVNPRRAAVVEDTPTGITAARSAGATVVAVWRGAVARSALADADVVVDTLWPQPWVAD